MASCRFPFRIGGTIDSPVFSKGKGDKDGMPCRIVGECLAMYWSEVTSFESSKRRTM